MLYPVSLVIPVICLKLAFHTRTKEYLTWKACLSVCIRPQPTISPKLPGVTVFCIRQRKFSLRIDRKFQIPLQHEKNNENFRCISLDSEEGRGYWQLLKFWTLPKNVQCLGDKWSVPWNSANSQSGTSTGSRISVTTSYEYLHRVSQFTPRVSS
jgi:hypothetical protein